MEAAMLRLFQTSLDEGTLPRQWRNAKIIPLRKPDKPNYQLAKAYRPISLLATLGKILESVVADRISYTVEEFGLLPTNHFGARKRRSTEQALALLQEHIYKAWRSKKVLSFQGQNDISTSLVFLFNFFVTRRATPVTELQLPISRHHGFQDAVYTCLKRVDHRCLKTPEKKLLSCRFERGGGVTSQTM
jgi:hypothetical protein